MKNSIVFISTLIVLGSFLLPKTSCAQINRYDFETLDSLQHDEPRNVLVFIHADWCRYCRVMENHTFKDEKVAKLLNNDFYFVSLDGEEKREVYL